MKQLQTLSVVSPGFYGLNTQESGITLSPNFAQLTDNVVIDKYGRLGSRKGWQMRTDSGVTQLAGATIDFLLEHVNADNTSVVLSAGNNKLFKRGDGGDSLVDITPALSTVTANNWKGASLYDHALIVQRNHKPIVYSEGATTNSNTIYDHFIEKLQVDDSVATFDDLPEVPLVNDRYLTVDAYQVWEWDGSAWVNITPVFSFGVSYPRDVIAAYGRFWVHDGSSVYWSTDIADVNFPSFNGGTSGFLNISAVLPNNVDTIVALASHNGFLIIFCERNIVIYKGAENPLGDFSLSDVIAGVGCVARDTVQGTGGDLIFLSDTGVRSLGRLLQEKSLPMRDLTKNVRDDLLKDVNQERINVGDLSNVKSIYSEVNAFYLLSFPSTSTVYCLDMRQALEDGSSRVTVWYSYKATSFLRRRDRELMIGKTNGIGRYYGYSDNGVKYRLRYFSHYLDMGAPTTNKMLKQISATVIGGSNQSFVIKTNFDYQEAPRSYPFTIVTGDVSEYGISEYNVGEYSFGIILDSIKSSVGGSGNTIQIGFEADVNGNELSVQKIDMFVKTGRMS